MLFARYNPAVCAVAPCVAYSLFRLSARIASGATSLRVARLMLHDVVQGAAHVHECLGGRGS
jgi:hypothetical protein